MGTLALLGAVWPWYAVALLVGVACLAIMCVVALVGDL